jgi:hypothetical protein
MAMKYMGPGAHILMSVLCRLVMSIYVQMNSVECTHYELINRENICKTCIQQSSILKFRLAPVFHSKKLKSDLKQEPKIL